MEEVRADICISSRIQAHRFQVTLAVFHAHGTCRYFKPDRIVRQDPFGDIPEDAVRVATEYTVVAAHPGPVRGNIFRFRDLDGCGKVRNRIGIDQPGTHEAKDFRGGAVDTDFLCVIACFDILRLVANNRTEDVVAVLQAHSRHFRPGAAPDSARAFYPHGIARPVDFRRIPGMDEHPRDRHRGRIATAERLLYRIFHLQQAVS